MTIAHPPRPSRRQTSHAPVVIDIPGTRLDARDRERLRHPLTGGLILFARNWAGRRALSRLTSQVKAVRPDILICIDQEGGRVQRLRGDGYTPLPPMRHLGQQWDRDPMQAMKQAAACGFVMAAELRACGVDLSFAPVLDLDHGDSQVIGDRALHRDPRVVAMLAGALMHGMLCAGMAACGKHFPGHGYVPGDSHVTLPVDRRPLKAILADDASPYGWLAGRLPAIMPSHVVYSRVDKVPAGYSQRWLQDILRRRLGYTGAIFSDDLSMQGAQVDGGVVAAAGRALNAGCDMVLLCNRCAPGDPTLDEFLAGLEQARRAGQWSTSAEAEGRRRALLPATPPRSWRELSRDPGYLAARSCLG